MAETQRQTPHVVFLPSVGMGHLIPFLEFAKHLVRFHDFHVTCIIPTIGTPPAVVRAALQGLPPAITHIFLPPISFDDLAANTSTAGRSALAVILSLPSLRDVLNSLIVGNTRFVAFLADPFAIDAFDVAREFNLSPYLFFASNAMSLSFCFHLPKLDEMVSCEFRDLTEPIKIPGCIPVHGRDLLDPVQNRSSETYKWFLSITKRLGEAKGIVVNTFMDMEAGVLKALLQKEETGKPSIYPVGPLTRANSSDSDTGSTQCLAWLDHQPIGSVLFVSFGSGGTLSHAQLNELALGLEMSEQRFLLVVRSPNDESANAAYFDVESENNPYDFLPKGFLERTKGRGLVVPSWAPQALVLSHSSTGGFLTHCGWNSTLESVVNGVPLIAWPLYAEQKMNAVMLTEDIHVALRPKANENGLVVREEIAEVVKKLMQGEEGKKIRKRMKGLKEGAANVLQENGSSRKALSKLTLDWETQICN
ncbi:Glycosyltransferase [Melia azedarach]|uniref:Glycosyltransferase n=1 Tax=Melia azedarach TaxID=155640 RepID=A0ACC1WQ16_MELAZ|nr:Glycosyltransferase [Melia azedarach]